jgi:hypothetical protein
MIVTAGFAPDQHTQTQECLRCGHIEYPAAISKPVFTDAETAKRFSDKAAEAEQVITTARTSRRETLIRISQAYIRTAQQLESLADAKSKKGK